AVSKHGERGCQRVAAFYVASTPHPQPLPTTRFARRGRGADMRSSNSNPKSHSPGTVRDRPARFGVHPGLAAGFGELAHAHDVALPLSHRDHAARIQQVEDM